MRTRSLKRKDFDAYLKNPESTTHKDFDTYIASVVTLSSDEADRGLERSLEMTDSEYETICIENLKEQLGE